MMATNKRRIKDILSNAKIVAIQDQVSTKLENEAVILNIKDGVYYGLNPVGARIWDLLQEPVTVGEIRDILVDEYEVDPLRCKEDLLNLLQDLSDRGLIGLTDEPAS
jgi:Coenzyme PQQ synthesis protein D (PqqD)